MKEEYHSFIFLVFGLGFFLFCAYLCTYENRREQRHTDYRNDLEYQRVLQERREFGYQVVENAIQSRSFFRKQKYQ